uniref:Fungal lipase-type domain-containing protein n=1 Tax=Chromera velia CCMP2878 TaxID=1169474 RepID=A0A0G4I6V2_9ALVE|eukprot:Cvel_1896.t1-p1 / transcript=Cvel_1896.t1 / gene=Cvel_1896 / organism=Chromera_velia_CCMP2878 / gene_product=hypothetical protein / transcript_product=hypothetical protein / location=Cvel_scaffold71:6742-20184(+) / protein_length=1725 / sequence_SO=supercontig / SO=protein_coding / is_pseudo=false
MAARRETQNDILPERLERERETNGTRQKREVFATKFRDEQSLFVGFFLISTLGVLALTLACTMQVSFGLLLAVSNALPEDKRDEMVSKSRYGIIVLPLLLFFVAVFADCAFRLIDDLGARTNPGKELRARVAGVVQMLLERCGSYTCCKKKRVSGQRLSRSRSERDRGRDRERELEGVRTTEIRETDRERDTDQGASSNRGSVFRSSACCSSEGSGSCCCSVCCGCFSGSASSARVALWAAELVCPVMFEVGPVVFGLLIFTDGGREWPETPSFLEIMQAYALGGGAVSIFATILYVLWGGFGRPSLYSRSVFSLHRIDFFEGVYLFAYLSAQQVPSFWVMTTQVIRRYRDKQRQRRRRLLAAAAAAAAAGGTRTGGSSLRTVSVSALHGGGAPIGYTSGVGVPLQRRRESDVRGSTDLPLTRNASKEGKIVVRSQRSALRDTSLTHEGEDEGDLEVGGEGRERWGIPDHPLASAVLATERTLREGREQKQRDETLVGEDEEKFWSPPESPRSSFLLPVFAPAPANSLELNRQRDENRQRVPQQNEVMQFPEDTKPSTVQKSQTVNVIGASPPQNPFPFPGQSNHTPSVGPLTLPSLAKPLTTRQPTSGGSLQKRIKAKLDTPDVTPVSKAVHAVGQAQRHLHTHIRTPSEGTAVKNPHRQGQSADTQIVPLLAEEVEVQPEALMQAAADRSHPHHPAFRSALQTPKNRSSEAASLPPHLSIVYRRLKALQQVYILLSLPTNERPPRVHFPNQHKPLTPTPKRQQKKKGGRGATEERLLNLGVEEPYSIQSPRSKELEGGEVGGKKEKYSPKKHHSGAASGRSLILTPISVKASGRGCTISPFSSKHRGRRRRRSSSHSPHSHSQSLNVISPNRSDSKLKHVQGVVTPSEVKSETADAGQDDSRDAPPARAPPLEESEGEGAVIEDEEDEDDEDEDETDDGLSQLGLLSDSDCSVDQLLVLHATANTKTVGGFLTAGSAGASPPPAQLAMPVETSEAGFGGDRGSTHVDRSIRPQRRAHSLSVPVHPVYHRPSPLPAPSRNGGEEDEASGDPVRRSQRTDHSAGSKRETAAARVRGNGSRSEALGDALPVPPLGGGEGDGKLTQSGGGQLGGAPIPPSATGGGGAAGGRGGRRQGERERERVQMRGLWETLCPRTTGCCCSVLLFLCGCLCCCCNGVVWLFGASSASPMDSLRRANEMERRERQREAAAVALGHGEGGGWCARGPLSSFFWLRILRSLRCDRRSAQQAYLYSAAGGCYATVIVLVESGKQAGLSFASVMVLLALQEFSREVLGRPWHESVLEGPRHSSLGEEGPQFTPSHARAQQNKQTLSSSNFQRRFRRGRSPSGVFNDTEGFSHWIAAGYPVCGMRYGSLVPPPDRAPERSEESNASSQGKEGGEPLSILDMALLAASAYWSDEGTINDLLNRFFRNNKTHIDFEVGMLENESLIGRAVEVFFPSQNLTVVAIRGTASKADAFADLDFWSAIAGVQMIDRFFVPLLSWLPKRFVQSALSVTLTDFSEPFSLVVERLEKFVQDVATRRGLPEEAEYTARGAQLLLVGHSLGGGLATLLGTQLSRPAVTFSAPGIYYTSSRYGISDLRMQQLVTAVVPERDPVPQVDVVRGLVQHVNCASRRAEHCHMMYMTMCELFCRCGDPREWVKNLCDGLARRYSLRWSGCVGGGSIPSSPSSSTSAPAPSATRAVAKSEAETQAVGGSKPNRQEPTVYA